MKCYLHIPYINYDDINFDSKYNISTDQYIDEMKREIDATGQDIYENMSKGLENIKSDIRFNAASKDIKEDSANYNLASCECNLLDINQNDMSIDMLIKLFQSQEQFIIIVEMNPDTMDEEFEAEIRMWNTTHNNINKYNEASDEWKLLHEPIRNFKLTIENNNGTKSYADLTNCKIADVYNNYIYAILVDKINFIKNI